MDDLINRQAAIDILEEQIHINGYSNVGMVSAINKSIGCIMRLPAAEKKGKWKEVQVPFGRDFTTKEYECEICGYRQLYHENFCGRCGAKMEEI